MQGKEVKTILNKTKRRDPWFLDDYTLNPYSGCSFNCLYCYIRGSKYGEHMDKSMSFKSNAPELLEKKLSILARKGKYGIIVMSSATDPYLQIERETGLTRRLLEIILKYKFPLHVITKSDLVIRDIDMLKEISNSAVLPKELEEKLKSKVIITFSFSTVDDITAGIFEPGATLPSQRLAAVKKILQEGFHTGISMMPLIPYISDTSESIEAMFAEFSKARVKYLIGSGITLFGSGPADSKKLMLNAVSKYYPQLSEKYKKIFTGSNILPAYYTKALKEKINQMCRKFNIPSSIIQH